VYRSKEDLISIGAYARGSDVRVDYAIERLPAIDAFLRQPVDETVPADEAEAGLLELTAPGQSLELT
jgi:flagellum-specific ATP synthase